MDALPQPTPTSTAPSRKREHSPSSLSGPAPKKPKTEPRSRTSMAPSASVCPRCRTDKARCDRSAGHPVVLPGSEDNAYGVPFVTCKRCFDRGFQCGPYIASGGASVSRNPSIQATTTAAPLPPPPPPRAAPKPKPKKVAPVAKVAKEAPPAPTPGNPYVGDGSWLRPSARALAIAGGQYTARLVLQGLATSNITPAAQETAELAGESLQVRRPPTFLPVVLNDRAARQFHELTKAKGTSPTVVVPTPPGSVSPTPTLQAVDEDDDDTSTLGDFEHLELAPTAEDKRQPVLFKRREFPPVFVPSPPVSPVVVDAPAVPAPVPVGGELPDEPTSPGN